MNLKQTFCRHAWAYRSQSTFASAYRDGAWVTADGSRANYPVLSDYHSWHECVKCGVTQDGDMRDIPAIIVTDVFSNKPPARHRTSPVALLRYCMEHRQFARHGTREPTG